MDIKINIHPIIRELLANRGIVEDAEIEEFLSVKPQRTYNPFLMKDLEMAVDQILSAIEQQNKICIYGDYDMDGITSVALLLQILSHLTDNVSYHIPCRFEEGYGLNKEAIEKISKSGVDLIITVDCGSVSYDEVEFAKSLGLNIIVTDHHNIDHRKPDCLVINPKQEDCEYPFSDLCGCGVAFKLAQGIQRKSGLPKKCLNEVLDLASMATIGDIVPLVDENRTLVKFGLNAIKKNQRPGLKQLLACLKLDPQKLSSGTVAFTVVPHFNASGRMASASTGVSLLITEDVAQAHQFSQELVTYNNQRKQEQEIAYEKCLEVTLKHYPEDDFLVIDGGDSHEGITGIVAGKLKDYFHKPVIIVTADDSGTLLKGTGRSLKGIDLHQLLKENDDLFTKFGGHAAACGFSMKEENLPILRKNLNQVAGQIRQQSPELFRASLNPEKTLQLKDLTKDFVSQLELMGPFGLGNEKPLFIIRHVYLQHSFPMGADKKHRKLIFTDETETRAEAVFFSPEEKYLQVLNQGAPMDLYGYPDLNQWNGSVKVQFLLRAVELSQAMKQ